MYTEFLHQTPWVLSPAVYFEQWCIVSDRSIRTFSKCKGYILYNLLHPTIRCRKNHIFVKENFN